MVINFCGDQIFKGFIGFLFMIIYEVFYKGSATIPNHINGSRNHLEFLLESGNQVETFKSRIIISNVILGYLVFFHIL